MTTRRETQMGDQLIFISFPLKFDLVYVTINRHQIRTGVLYYAYFTAKLHQFKKNIRAIWKFGVCNHAN